MTSKGQRKMTTEKESSKSTPESGNQLLGSTATAKATAGRDLDVLVLEKVLGYQWWRSSSSGNRCLFPPGKKPGWFNELADGTEPLVSDWKMMRIPACSTDIAAAWEVVERLREYGWVIGLWIDDEPWDAADEDGTHACSLLGCNRGRTDPTDIREYADTTPLAICLAALRAVDA